MSIETVTIDKIKYVCVDYIKTNASFYFKGSRNGKELVINKEIDDDEYIYARQSGSSWVESDGKSNRYDKVFLTFDYVKENEMLWKELNGELEDEAPEIIQLKKSEKFKDDEGNVYDVETRGERECDKIFFRVRDVNTMMEMNDLRGVVKDARNGYEKDRDYVIFICIDRVQNTNETNGVKRIMFLTYRGLLRVLFTSKSGIAYSFVEWATQILFTAHLGTADQKINLASKLIKVDSKVIHEVFNKTSRKMSCVYLIIIGTVKNLRESMKIPESFKDTDNVYKFGMAVDLDRRIKEHEKDYGKYKGSDIIIDIYEYVDPQYISDAETSVKSFFEASEMMLSCDNHKELVVIPKKYYPNVKKYYSTVGTAYMGHLTELMNELNKKISEIKVLKAEHETAIARKDNELSKKDTELLKKDNELLRQQNEINMLKKDLAEANKKIKRQSKKLAELEN